MKRGARNEDRAITTAGTLGSVPLANPWYQTDFPPEEFKARWEKVLKESVRMQSAATNCEAGRRK
jgi:hypothetical protein